MMIANLFCISSADFFQVQWLSSGLSTSSTLHVGTRQAEFYIYGWLIKIYGCFEGIFGYKFQWFTKFMANIEQSCQKCHVDAKTTITGQT